MTDEAKPSPSNPRRWRREWLLPLVLAIATSSWMLAVEGRQGIGRDESQYFRAGEHYWGWFESVAKNLREGHVKQAFTRPAVDGGWDDNHEHPPLMKILFGVSWRLFHTCECTTAKRSLHPIPITTVPQHQAYEALMRLRAGRVIGRLVLKAEAA